jgi:hypothetical protein
MIRKWFTTVSLLALLLSAWGSVFAASMCPHMKDGHACCHARVEHHPSSSHEGMAGMEMYDAQSEAATECTAPEHATTEHKAVAETSQNANSEAAGQSNEACTHCMSHSKLPATPASLREASRTERDEGQTQAPPPSKSIDIYAAAFTGKPAAKEHAPPVANGSARHVLINVFRI